MNTEDILALGSGAAILLILSTRKKKLTNEEHISTLDPKYQSRFRGFVTELKQKGFLPVISSSARSLFKQAVQKIKDPRNAPVGKSTHTKRKARAIDLNVKYKGKYLGKKTPKAEWIASGVPVIAKKYGLKWGGDFATYYDPVHYEAV